MKRMKWAALVLTLGFASLACAQMGMDIFRRPSFTKLFHPVIGQGAAYQTAGKSGPDAKPRTMEMGLVGKESVDGKDGYWMQIRIDTGNGITMVGKTLITPVDFQVYRTIIQMPGQPAMEMPVNMSAANRGKMQESMEDWHSVGTESVTVPAGTFSCEHWKNDKTGGEVWSSDKVFPFGMVKEAGKDGSTTILVKVLSDYPDRITGPVQKFDPQLMMQLMQQQRQSQ
jgi:hypothetical protein